MSPTYKRAREKVRDRWGSDARERVGDVIYQALIAEAVFFTLAAQDRAVPSDAVREIIAQCHTDIIDEIHGKSMEQ